MTATTVLICRGCDISSTVDLSTLEQLARTHSNVKSVKSVPCFCDEIGSKLIYDEANSGAEKLVLVGCSQRFVPLKTDPQKIPVERVPLRELVTWSHTPRCESTQSMAEDYLRMALIRSDKIKSTPPQLSEVERVVLVVGGGVTGLSAAKTVVELGYSVVLVENANVLGGWLRHSPWLIPSNPPFSELEKNPLNELIEELSNNNKIRILQSTTILSISGEPGRFDVELKHDSLPITLRVGAVIQATGWEPYDAKQVKKLGYGSFTNVVTNVEFEQMLASGHFSRPSDGNPVKRIAFIQCAGSRDTSHLPYCSSVCCSVSLKQAIWARKLDPSREVYIVARDIRTLGLEEAFYRRAQEDPGIFITKGIVEQVDASVRNDLTVTINAGLLGESISIDADLVVLAVGMRPRISNLDQQVSQPISSTCTEELGLTVETTGKTNSDVTSFPASTILGLRYRQGPDLPLDRYGFPDSHFICFPYETRRTGIYTAGALRSPNNHVTCTTDGAGAALKAIQAIEHAEEGLAMHPRWGDPTPPLFSLQRCTQCKRCTEECPFGTLDEDERCTPKLNPTRCRRCGICFGACPERIISFPDYSVDLLSSMLKSVPIPDEFEESPRILVFACENDAYPALELAGLHRTTYSSFVRIIPVRCLGAINVVWIADAMAMGYDGVLLLGCKPGDDTQCHYVRGSELMTTRSENVKQKLTQMALENSRIRIEYVNIADYIDAVRKIEDFVSTIADVGLNPFKGV